MATFRSVQRVYFDDLDALNILHNVRYLLFIERARGELFQSLGFRWTDDAAHNPDKWHVVAAHEIRYLKPVTGEQEIAIHLQVSHWGNTSFTLDAKVTNTAGDITYATSATRLVRIEQETGKPCPWSQGFKKALEPYRA